MDLDRLTPKPLVPAEPEAATGPLIWTLSDEDMAWTEEVGTARQKNGRRKGYKNILSIGGTAKDIMGARGKLAVARAYGATWRDPFRLDVERFHDPDVGNVDVRATGTLRGGLPIRPRDLKARANVLVIVRGAECRIIGWCWGWEARRDDYWREANRNGPGYWSVPQPDLHDPAWLPVVR